MNISDGCVIAQCPKGGWTPDGCVDATINEVTCTSLGRTFLPKAVTATQCSTKVKQLCIDSTVSNEDRQQIISTLSNHPFGYSPLRGEECTNCGGQLVDYFTWSPAKWVPSGGWIPFKWTARNVTKPNKWDSTFSSTAWIDLFEHGKARRLAVISKNQLMCSYGYKFDALESLTCACSGDGDCNQLASGSTQVSETTVGSISLCTGVSGVVNVSRGYIKVPVRITLDFLTLGLTKD